VAKNLRNGKSGLIGFVVSNLENSFYVSITKGIEKAINSYDYKLLLIDSAESKKKEMENVESLYHQGVEGLIIVPTASDCSYLKDIVPQDFPIVFTDRKPKNWDADMVLLDNKEAAYQVTDSLISHGLREIGFVAIEFGDNENDYVISERVDGYKEALKRAGISFRSDYLKIATLPPTIVNELLQSHAYNLTDELLKTPVQGIISGNNHTAIGLYSCLKDRNVRIPQDMAVITFDDDFWLQMVTPPISALAQPAARLGQLSAERLFFRMHRPHDAKEQFRLKARFIPRASSLIES
jgi:LacI family transcriptional regulator